MNFSRTWLSRLFIVLFSLSLSVVLLLDTVIKVEAETPQTGIQLSQSAQTQMTSLHKDKLSRTPAQRKIGSHLLYELKKTNGQAIAKGVPTLETAVELDTDGNVLVDIQAKVTDGLLQKIKNAGGNIINSFAQYNAIRAMIPLSQVEVLASLDDIKFIRPAVKAKLSGGGISSSELKPKGTSQPQPSLQSNRLSISGSTLAQRASDVRGRLPKILANPKMLAGGGVFIGSVTSEGDVAHSADQARSKFYVDGTGVKVGVLSDSYNCLGGAAQDIVTGDLPSKGVTVLQGYDDPAVHLSCNGATDEGRAMLQIVHDLAPGATLYFATSDGGNANLAYNIIRLREAGCDVIIDDLVYPDESPFQDDIIAQAVNYVVTDGATYFSSAGNQGNFDDQTSSTWEGDFVDSGISLVGQAGGHFHSFGSKINNQIITQSDFETTRVRLFWSDPLGASSNDYDFYIFNPEGTKLITASTNIQDGSQDPYEYIAPTLPDNSLVAVVLSNGQPRYLHLNVGIGSNATLATSTPGEITGHQAAVRAFTVAAVNARNKTSPFTGGAANPVETFSSDGLRRVFYNADGTPITPDNFLSTGGFVRQKPDIAAADGVVTTLPSDSGLNPFYGTSAAAPHAGAIAALMKSFEPYLNRRVTPELIRTALTSTALDIEAPGVDRDSGWGIVMALQALQWLSSHYGK